MIRLAILGSGSGSNALNIIEQSKDRKDVQVGLIISNVAGAGILQHALNNGIPAVQMSNNELNSEQALLNLLKEHHIDWIVLAGFLRKIGPNICQAFPNKIINIHPALLPKYGGKGMYGQKVHEAVIADKATQTGITIHLVNEKYDDGTIILQKEIAIDANDTPETIANKVQKLEHTWYSQAIETLINN